MSDRLRTRRIPITSAVRHAGLRTCVGCQARDERSALLRAVAFRGNAAGSEIACPVVLLPDERNRLPGRGVWLHPQQDCFQLADRRRAFGRALRITTSVNLNRVQEWIALHT